MTTNFQLRGYVNLRYKNGASLLRSSMAVKLLLVCNLGVASMPLAHADVLKNMIAETLEKHPAVLAQLALARAGEANVDTARWQFYPTPSVTVEGVSAEKKDITYLGDDRTTTLRLQQPLWMGGKLTAGLEKTKEALTVSQIGHEEVRQQLAIRFVQAYSDWLSAYLRLLAYQRSLAEHMKFDAQVRRRIEQGASSESDRILVASRLDSVSAEIAQANGQKNAARVRMSQLLGREIGDEDLSRSLALPYELNVAVQQLLESALSTHPSILKSRSQAKVQGITVGERKAEFLPQVYLRAERQFGNYSAVNTEPVTRYFVGISSTLGAGLSARSSVDSAVAQHQAALIDVQTQERSVQEQLLADHAQLGMIENRLKLIQSSLAFAIQISDAYVRQFLAGRKTWIDVMNAARELTQIEVQLTQDRANQVALTWRLAITSYGLSQVLGETR